MVMAIKVKVEKPPIRVMVGNKNGIATSSH